MMDRNLALEAVRVTEAAAIAAARLMGRGEKDASDQAAVDAMRRALATMNIRGRIVIGEGERDEAPMLYIGELLGAGGEDAPRVDIAVDPLEGTNLCASGAADALSVIAMSEDGQLLNAPDMYMDKIAAGPAAKGIIDIRKSPSWNLKAIADAKGVYIEDLTAVVLERPRHEELIREIREAGARIRLIPDGDVSAAIATCFEESGVDVLFGSGGAPEGVLAAAALRCVGGEIQARLLPRNQDEIDRAKAMGIHDLNKIFYMEDLAGGDVMFAATGVTNGSFLKGVRFFKNGAETHSVIMRSRTGTVRFVQARHDFLRKPVG